jgi:hypothetical protein
MIPVLCGCNDCQAQQVWVSEGLVFELQQRDFFAEKLKASLYQPYEIYFAESELCIVRFGEFIR